MITSEVHLKVQTSLLSIFLTKLRKHNGYVQIRELIRVNTDSFILYIA